METQIELTLTNSYRNTLVGLLGIVLVMGVGIPCTLMLLDYVGQFISISLNEVKVCVSVVVGGGLLAIFPVARKVGGVPTLVTIAEDELRVLNHRNHKETRIPFIAIESYETTFFNGIEELRLKLRDGSQLKLTIETKFQDSQRQEFLAVSNGLKAAMDRYEALQPQGTPVALRNEFKFWSKPLATVVLVGFACLTASLFRVSA